MNKIIASVLCVAIMLCACGCSLNQSGEISYTADLSESESSSPECSRHENSITAPEISIPSESGEGEKNESTFLPDISEPAQEDTSAESSETGEESFITEESEVTEESKDTVQQESTKECSHKTTKTVDEVNATCTKGGYSGDAVCEECGVTIEKGNTTKPTGHLNTKIINTKIATTKQEGYTGDTYCYDCETIIETGIVIDKVVDKSDKATYTLPDGSKITVDKGENIRDYLLHLYTQYIKHENDNIEKEILRLVNIERKKVGVKPLEWNEDGYFFAEIRAEECCEKFSHTRPNGCGCETVYSDFNVLLSGYWGENLGRVTDNVEMTDTELAELIVDAWMNSPAHKANLLEEHFTSISIAYVHLGGYHIVVQNFFGE